MAGPASRTDPLIVNRGGQFFDRSPRAAVGAAIADFNARHADVHSLC